MAERLHTAVCCGEFWISTEKSDYFVFVIYFLVFFFQVRNVEGLCVLMLQSVANEEQVLYIVCVQCINCQVQLSDGMGQLLFEVCKGIQKQFHSCTEKVSILHMYINKLCFLTSSFYVYCIVKLLSSVTMEKSSRCYVKCVSYKLSIQDATSLYLFGIH